MAENTKENDKPSTEAEPIGTSAVNVGEIIQQRSSAPKVLIAIVLGLLVVGLMILAGLVIHKKIANNPLNINGILISQQQIKDYADEVGRYRKAHRSEVFTGSDKKNATDALILNAALKDQAKKHHITVTTADIGAKLAPQYKHYGSKPAYASAIKALDAVNMSRVLNENDTYEDKLQNDVLLRKELFVVAINYDTPYFNGLQNKAVEAHNINETLSQKFLPLFKSGVDQQTIAKQADYNAFTNVPLKDGVYFNQSVTTTFHIENYTGTKPYFNDIPKISAGDAVNTDDKIKSLTKVGQYTPIFKSQAGFIGIIRLESVSKGSYNSFEDLLKDYKNKYAKSVATAESNHQKVTDLGHSLVVLSSVSLKTVRNLVSPRAAATALSICNGGHSVNFVVTAIDNVSKKPIAGAKITETRNAVAGCKNSSGIYIGTSPDPNKVSQTATTTSSGAGVINDNCYNPYPTGWSRSDPTGYTYTGTTISPVATVHTYSTPAPLWEDGNLNAAGNVTWNLYYDPPPPVWYLTPETFVDKPTARVGDKVTFYSTITNSGDDNAVGFNYIGIGITTPAGGTPVKGTPAGTTGTNKTLAGSATIKVASNIYTVPNLAVGSTYCELLKVDPYRSPNPPEPYKNSAKKCVTVIADNTPGGTVACSSTDQFTGTNITDLDSPNKQLAYTIYKDSTAGTAVGSGTTSGSAFGPFDYKGLLGGSSHTFYAAIKGVNDKGVADGKDSVLSATCTPPGGITVTTGSSGLCPGDDKININSLVMIDLTDTTPANKTSDPGTYSTQAYDTYEQDVPKGKTEVVLPIKDVSSGGAQVPLTLQSESYQKATVDYQPFVNTYPYDLNQAAVDYKSYYTKTTWRTNGTVDHYECGDVSQTGNTCNYTYDASSTVKCSAGYDIGTICGDYLKAANNGVCPSGTSIFYSGCYVGGSYTEKPNTTTGKCPTTEFLADGNCYTAYTRTVTYYCNNNDKLTANSDGTHTCSGSYPATAYYKWFVDTTNNPPTIVTAPGTAYGYAMKDCFKRGFNVTSVTYGSTSYDDPEDPSSVTANGSASVNFVAPPGYPANKDLRQAVKVNGLKTVASATNYAGCPVDTYNNNNFIGGSHLDGPSDSLPLQPYTCTVQSPPLVAGQQVCVVTTMSPSTGLVDLNGTYSAPSGSFSSPESCTNPLSDQPYAHFFGLDVSAGGEFDDNANNCLASTNTTKGGITGSYKYGGGPLTRGSSAQFGALANDIVSGFASASIRPGSLPVLDPFAPSGLTFANDGVNGQLGAVQCIPDYFATLDSTTAPDNGSNNTVNTEQFHNPGGPDVTQAYYKPAAGGLTLKSPANSTGTFYDGKKIAIYVDGDVRITDNQTFNNKSWATVDDIPSFYLVVKGDIFIDPGVTELDGVYVAQKNTATNKGGTINTCADGFTSFQGADLFNNCSGKQLTVNGSFIAQHVQLSRTYASLRNSLGGEQPINPATDPGCSKNTSKLERTSAMADYDCAAEIFKTSPDTFMTSPAISPSGGKSKGKYDYITTLSPVL